MEEFDLSKLDVRPRAQEGVEVPLLDPAGKITPVKLRVRGSDSQAYQGKLEEQVRRQMERGARKLSEEERNVEFWELQASLLCGWSHKLVIAKGEAAVEYSPQNAARLLEEHAYIWEQVRIFSKDRENFLPGVVSSSSAS